MRMSTTTISNALFPTFYNHYNTIACFAGFPVVRGIIRLNIHCPYYNLRFADGPDTYKYYT
jgi:hypothetical protein